MEKRYLLICLHMMICNLSLFTTINAGNPKPFSLNENDSIQIEFKKNYKFEFYKNAHDSKPYGGFIMADSVGYLISEKKYKEVFYWMQKEKKLDSLCKELEQKIEVLTESRDTYKKWVDTERKIGDSLRSLSTEKSVIAREMASGWRKEKVKGIVLSSLIGLVGGLLWIREDDKTAIKVVKPFSICSAGFGLGMVVFINRNITGKKD